MLEKKLHCCPAVTTWGEVQHQEKLAPGVWSVCTAGHGGIIVATEVAHKHISENAKKCIPEPECGFYNFEEDCDWAIFAKENQSIVPEDWLQYIDGALQRWHPEYLAMLPPETPSLFAERN